MVNLVNIVVAGDRQHLKEESRNLDSDLIGLSVGSGEYLVYRCNIHNFVIDRGSYCDENGKLCVKVAYKMVFQMTRPNSPEGKAWVVSNPTVLEELRVEYQNQMDKVERGQPTDVKIKFL